MRWQDPDTRQVVELSKDFDTGELASDFEYANPYFQRAVIVAEYAEILKKSARTVKRRPIPYCRDGNSRLYHRSDVYAYLAEVRKCPSSSAPARRSTTPGSRSTGACRNNRTPP